MQRCRDDGSKGYARCDHQQSLRSAKASREQRHADGLQHCHERTADGTDQPPSEARISGNAEIRPPCRPLLMASAAALNGPCRPPKMSSSVLPRPENWLTTSPKPPVRPSKIWVPRSHAPLASWLMPSPRKPLTCWIRFLPKSSISSLVSGARPLYRVERTHCPTLSQS
mgnify:CR=1 FL=1